MRTSKLKCTFARAVIGMPIPFIVNNFSEYYQRQREIEQLKKRRLHEHREEHSRGKCAAAASNANPAGRPSAAGVKPTQLDITNPLMVAVRSPGRGTGPSSAAADGSISDTLVKGKAAAVELEGQPVPGNASTSVTIPTGTGPQGTGNVKNGLVNVWEKKKPAIGNGKVKIKAV